MRARTAAVFPLAVCGGAGAPADASATDLWATYLRPQYFGEGAIVEGKDVVKPGTRAYLSAAYLTQVVRKFNGEYIFAAAPAISIRAVPSFRFFFKPQAGGSMTAEMTAAKGRELSHSFAVAGTVAATAVH